MFYVSTVCSSFSSEATSSSHPSRTSSQAPATSHLTELHIDAGKNETLRHKRSSSSPHAGPLSKSHSICPSSCPEMSRGPGSQQGSSWSELLTSRRAPAPNPGRPTDTDVQQEKTKDIQFGARGFSSLTSCPDRDGPPCETCPPTPPDHPSTSSSITFRGESSHHVVCSTRERSTCSAPWRCVLDPVMVSSSPAAPRSLAPALPQRSNLHDALLPPPPHLLTPEPDANICQPVTICEEVRLTPRVRGPPLSAPPTPPQVDTESLPQGKGSKSAPRQPPSRASVMEVSGQPEPILTGWVAYTHLHSNTAA